jgi:hypothetical protein
VKTEVQGAKALLDRLNASLVRSALDALAAERRPERGDSSQTFASGARGACQLGCSDEQVLTNSTVQFNERDKLVCLVLVGR